MTFVEPFEDEIHPRLRFSHRGLVAMANNGEKNSNDSQFFITLGSLLIVLIELELELMCTTQIVRTNCTANTPSLGAVWEIRYTVRRLTPPLLCIANVLSNADVLKIGECELKNERPV
jgi:cyclophilin family peptidyl-prolyl cis-trans isomerase